MFHIAKTAVSHIGIKLSGHTVHGARRSAEARELGPGKDIIIGSGFWILEYSYFPYKASLYKSSPRVNTDSRVHDTTSHPVQYSTVQ